MTSKPGDVGRRLEWVEGPAVDVVLKTIELVGTVPGLDKSFEFGYDAVDRDLAEDEEPDPTEPVRWWVKVEMRQRLGRGRPVPRSWIRYAVYDPASVDPNAPTSHAQAIVLASVALLEAMGANVVLLSDLRTPPSTTDTQE